MSKKKLIIIQHNGGELANQLWNFISIYAYSLEKKLELKNYSFFEYSQYFNIPVSNKIIKKIFFKPFEGHTKRRDSKKTRFYRKLYKIFVILVEFFNKKNIVDSSSKNNLPYYLPPSTEIKKEFIDLENNNTKNIYFKGWLFRNPTGIEKYRNEIIEYFKPKKDTVDLIDNMTEGIRSRYQKLIGVHIRQGDYKTFKDGKYFIDQIRTREIIEEYLNQNNLHIGDVCFIITSDGEIDANIFDGLNFVTSSHNLVEDMYLLSSTDIIIGSNSSYGNIAAYFGNIPHFIMENEKIDWGYYEGKNEYFINKYCTMVKF